MLSSPFYVTQEKLAFPRVFLPFCVSFSRASGSNRILKRDVMKTYSPLWKNDAVCCLSRWSVREKENPWPALELRAWKVMVSIAEPLCVLCSALSPSWEWGCLHVRHAVQCFIRPQLGGTLACGCSWTPKTLQVFNVCAGRLLPFRGVILSVNNQVFSTNQLFWHWKIAWWILWLSFKTLFHGLKSFFSFFFRFRERVRSDCQDTWGMCHGQMHI